MKEHKPCDKDCFNCKFSDCIYDRLDAEDYRRQAKLDKEITQTPAQKKLAAQQRAYREANKEKLAMVASLVHRPGTKRGGRINMDREQTAIERLQTASEMSIKHYGRPLVVTTSGGKDSAVCIALAERAGIPFEVMHNHTTIDAPETVRFVREDFRRLEQKGIKCTINFPAYKGRRVTMWSLIPQMLMPPTRLLRYCCSVLKERGGRGRFITTGVRWAESVKRKNNRGIYEAMPRDRKKKIILNNDNDDHRRLFETCTLKAKRVCNPIIDWTNREIWDYIRAEHISMNPLYRCGYSRVGCIGCPLAGKEGRQQGLARYPTYKAAYIRAFDRMIEERKRRGKETTWETGIDVFHWWMEDGVLPGQLALDDLAELMEEDDL